MMAMPADANPNGDIFGGWLLSQMDLGGGSLAAQRAKGRCATVAVDGMVFSSETRSAAMASSSGRDGRR